MSSKDQKNITQKQQPPQKKPALSVSKPNQNKWIWVALGVVLLTTFAIYFKAIKFDFLITWDDNFYITYNNAIKDLHWANIKLFFTEFFVWNYQPITMLMYAIEYKLVGNSASLYHLNNIIFHLINTYLVFILVRKISPKNAVVALITAAFFAIHPMHVESVAWVAERKDVLYSFFFLLSLIVYTNYLKSDKLKHLILAGVFFTLSCLSKSAAVILPLVMFLFDYYFNRKYTWKMFVEKLPFFVISLIFGIVAMNSQTTAINDTFSKIAIIDRISLVSYSVISYLFKAFVPVNLSAIYPYPLELGGPLPIVYYFSIFCICCLLFFVWFSLKWGKDVIFGFCFFIITIILVLQFIPVGNATMADRYTYIPYIGVFYIAGKYIEYLANRISTKYITIVLIIGFVVFSSISNARVKKWENDETLFSDVIAKYPYGTVAYNNRGCYYLDIAKNKFVADVQSQERYYRYALQDFEKINALNENYLHNYYNRGLAKYYLKDFTKAIEDFDKEILKDSKAQGCYFFRALAKNEIKDYSGAIKDFDSALEIDSNVSEIYHNRGNTKKELNDYTGALKDYDKALELNPTFINAYNNRSILRCILKDYEGTIADYDKMIELNPDDTTTIKNRKIIKSLLENSKK